MITRIIAFCGADRTWAQALAASGADVEAALVEVSALSPAPLEVGRHLCLCALWSGAGEEADATTLAAALENARQRGFCLIGADVAAPASLMRSGVPFLRSQGDAQRDTAAIAEASAEITSGRRIANALAPSPPPPRVSPRPKLNAATRTPRPDQPARATYSPAPRRGPNSRSLGIVLGAAVGAAVFFLVVAPLIGNWVAGLDAQAPLLGASAPAPPSGRASTAQIEELVTLQPAQEIPPLDEELRGFSPERPAP